MIDKNWINETQSDRAKNIKDKIYDILKGKDIKISTGTHKKYLANYKLHIYLQGSHKKSTDLENSDIDILVSVARIPNPLDLEFKNFEENKKWQEEYSVSFADGNFDEWGNEICSQEILNKLGGRSIVDNNIEEGKRAVKDILRKLGQEIRKILISSNQFDIINFSSKGLKIKYMNEEFDIIPSIIYFNVDWKNMNLKSIGVSILDDIKKEILVNYPSVDWYETNEKNKNTDSKYKKVIKFFKGYSKINNFNLKGIVIEQIIFNVPNEIFTEYENIWASISNITFYLLNNYDLYNENFNCTQLDEKKCKLLYNKVKNEYTIFKDMLKKFEMESKNDEKFTI